MMPLRARLSASLYKRSSLPFRTAFKLAAHVRTRRPFRQLVTGNEDAFLTRHTVEYYAELWKFGYHRMFDVVSHLDPELDRANLKVLSIGPRTEIELYYLWLIFGFEWDNIVGLDIVSPSPKIEIGNMGERLPFSDDSFDVVIASHCLEKSPDAGRTRDEIYRVIRAGGYVCAAGNRVTEEQLRQRTSDVPQMFFRDGLPGFIDHYGVKLENIDYLNARSPSGYEIIFRVRK
jgi:SAM-dependent methyltransferase